MAPHGKIPSKQIKNPKLAAGSEKWQSSLVFVIIIYRTVYTKVMTNPANPTAELWRETCPDQLVGLVDALRLCNQQVLHPLVLRSSQRTVRCSNDRNLRALATQLVTIVSHQHLAVELSILLI